MNVIKNSVKQNKGGDEAVVVCGVDGTIYTLDAWTGQLRGLFASGGTIVESDESTVTPTDSTPDEVTINDILEQNTLHHNKKLSDINDQYIPRQDSEDELDDDNDTLSLRERIIPGLDGNIYSLTESMSHGETTGKRLQVLPVQIEDVINSPVQTCREKVTASGKEFQGYEEECGLIMGQKNTRIFAIDPMSGTVQWMQNPNSKESGFTSSQMAVKHKYRDAAAKPVLLQREDYSVRQVNAESGDELWAVRMGKFKAIKYESVADEKNFSQKNTGHHENPSGGNVIRKMVPSLPLRSGSDFGTRIRTNRGYHHEKFRSATSLPDEVGNNKDGEIQTAPFDPFPSFSFGEDGCSVIAIDSITGRILWKRKIESFVVAIYGVGKESRWEPLNTIDDIDVHDSCNGEEESACSAKDSNNVIILQNNVMKMSKSEIPHPTLPLASSQSLTLDKNLMQLSILDNIYQLGVSHQQRIDSLFMKEYMTKNGKTSHALLLPSVEDRTSVKVSHLPDIDHNKPDNYIEDEDNSVDGESLFYEIVYDDDDIEFMLQKHNPLTMPDITPYQQSRLDIIKSTHKNEYGLFISWDMMTALLSCLIGGLLMGRFFYIKKRRKWRSESVSESSDALLNNINDMRGEEYPKQIAMNGRTPSEISLGQETNLPLSQLERAVSNSGEKTTNREQNATSATISPVLRSASLPILNNHPSSNGSDQFLLASTPVLRIEESKSHEGMELPPPLQATTPSELASVRSHYISNNISTAESKRNVKSSTPHTGNLDGIPLVRYSRYKSEFNEISALGKGGFGTVFKCTNTLDGREYAVKKVLIRTEIDSNGRLTEEFSQKLHRVLREVKILALLDHPHIIRYYTAWIESEEDGDEFSTDFLGGSTLSDPSLTHGYSSELLAGNVPSSHASSHYLSKRNESCHHKMKYDNIEENPLGWNTFLTRMDQSDFDMKPPCSGSFEPDFQRSASLTSNEDTGFNWDHGSTVSLKRTTSNTESLTTTCNTTSDSNINSASISNSIKVDQNELTKKSIITSNYDVKSNGIDLKQIQVLNESIRSESSQSTASSQSTVESTSSQSAIESNQSSFKGNGRSFKHDKSQERKNIQSQPTVDSPRKRLQTQKHILYIQMQLSKKTLLDHFQAREETKVKGVDIPSALTIFSDVAQGVKHVHEMRLIHRDLKPSNCFMDDSGIKIGDFGLSRESGSRKDTSDDIEETDEVLRDSMDITTGVGTSSYASPEQMNGSDYDASTDVYSLGIILFELCYPMYTGMERLQVFDGIRSQVFPSEWHSTVGKQFPSIHSLLLAMLSPHPTNRPSSTDVVIQIKSFLSEYTVLSLTLDSSSKREGSIFLRVEADDNEGVLARTMKLMKDTAPDVTILQYSLRGHDSKAIMEFALVVTTSEDREDSHVRSGDLHDPIESIFIKLQESREIKLVRQVNDENIN